MKGQVSNEAMVVYGIMILAVLITVGIVVSGSIFKGNILSSSTCKTGGGFACKEFQALRGDGSIDIELRLQNEKGYAVKDVKVEGGSCTAFFPETIIPGEELLVFLSGCLVDSNAEEIEWKFTITSVTVSSNIPHQESGMIIAEVQG